MLKEKKTKTIQIRMTEEDYNDLTNIAFLMGTTPSQFARQLIQMSINASKSQLLPKLEEMKKESEMKLSNENQ